MKSIRTLSVAIAAALFLAPAIAHADYLAGNTGTLGLTRISGYYAGSGGEFTMFQYSAADGFLDTSAYADSTKNTKSGGTVASFQTFCVERGETTASPVTTWVSTTSVAGGVGSHADLGGTGVGDDLEAQTAYLYTQFATGQLKDYFSYDNGYTYRRDLAAQQLQYAIWFLEGELSSVTSGTRAAAWVAEANAAVASGAWQGIGNVRVLNNYKNGVRKQDQLWLSPASVPMPAAFLIGLPLLGLIGLVRLVRRPRS